MKQTTCVGLLAGWLFVCLALSACGHDEVAFSAGDGDADGDATEDDAIFDGDAQPDGDQSSAGDEPDGDRIEETNDSPDGDMEAKGEVWIDPDGDGIDGEAPLPCHGDCIYGDDRPFCSTDTDLCWCDETDQTYGIVDCEQICRTEYQSYGGVCDYDDSVRHDRCLCPSSDFQCGSDAECEARGSNYCVGTTDDQGSFFTFCMDACDIVSCDPGSDRIPCVDYGPPGQPLGACYDSESPGCDTPNEFCGGDENHICLAFQGGNPLCMERCEPIPNSCGGDILCIPLSNTQTGVLAGGGCWVW